jgi:ADP-ribosylglycohydrolase
MSEERTTEDSQPRQRLERARASLEGLAVGDAFGERFFAIRSDFVEEVIATRTLPQPPWTYTDDTQMALSVVSILRQHGKVNQDRLARTFAERYEYARGYGPGMQSGLRRIREGAAWQDVARSQFGRQGSYGNGAAMRIAPLGVYFADDLDLVVEQARLSAEVTHVHLEGVAGAIAVAVAAAWASRLRATSPPPGGAEFLDLVLPHVPESEVASRIRRGRDLTFDRSIWPVVGVLGNGSRVSAQDTVPFALWCAAQHLDSYEEALWLAASGLGDVDTVCAMVGGIVAGHVGAEGIPQIWKDAAERLPNWPFVSEY